MIQPSTQRDLVVLVGDRNIEYAIKGILTRYQSLKISQPLEDVYVHPGHDPGCFHNSHEFLRNFVNSHKFALVMFDLEGCGQQMTREEVETHVEDFLSRNGWNGRSAAIVIDPEIDIWVWNNSPHVDEVLGWKGRKPNLWKWLKQRGFMTAPNIKPAPPKEALEAALRSAGKAKSSSIFKQLAHKVGLHKCSDPAFLKLKRILRTWFSPQ